jgi:ERCC4-type nuclease
MKSDEFTIIVDTREQNAWEFGHHTTSRRKLDTGDYSIEGLENLLCIERKQSVSEVANNITEKRFANVLERMSEIPHRFMLFEFDLQDVYDFPVGSDIPKNKWNKLRVSSNYIIKYLSLINTNYNIHTIYCGDADNAEKMAVRIMRTVYGKYNQN